MFTLYDRVIWKGMPATIISVASGADYLIEFTADQTDDFGRKNRYVSPHELTLATPQITAEQLVSLLSTQTFADFYASEFTEYIADGTKSKEEIVTRLNQLITAYSR